MYCDAISPQDIAEKIALMMSDAATRQRYRTKGIAHAREYRWDRSAKRLLEVLYGREGEPLPDLAEPVSAN